MYCMVAWPRASVLTDVGFWQKRNAKSKKVFTQVFTFGGIYLFTDRVITYFGSNFRNIS